MKIKHFFIITFLSALMGTVIGGIILNFIQWGF